MSSRDNHQEVTLAITEALAAKEGVPATDFEYVLQDHVELDALTALCTAETNGDWELRFTVSDYTVIVDDDGFVTVDGERVPIRA